MDDVFVIKPDFTATHVSQDDQTEMLAWMHAVIRVLNDDRVQAFVTLNVDFRLPDNQIFGSSNAATYYLDSLRRWNKIMDNPGMNFVRELPAIDGHVDKFDAMIRGYENKKNSERLPADQLARVALHIAFDQSQAGTAALMRDHEERILRLETAVGGLRNMIGASFMANAANE